MPEGRTFAQDAWLRVHRHGRLQRMAGAVGVCRRRTITIGMRALRAAGAWRRRGAGTRGAAAGPGQTDDDVRVPRRGSAQGPAPGYVWAMHAEVFTVATMGQVRDGLLNMASGGWKGCEVTAFLHNSIWH